jgi:hypothetical protein
MWYPLIVPNIELLLLVAAVGAEVVDATVQALDLETLFRTCMIEWASTTQGESVQWLRHPKERATLFLTTNQEDVPRSRVC